MTVTVADDAIFITVSVSIDGFERKSVKVADNTDDERERRVEREVKETIAHVEQYALAKKLETACRSLLVQHGQSTVIGYLTNPARLEKFVESWYEIQKLISEHNARDVYIHGTPENQPHKVNAEYVALPIGRVLDQRTQVLLSKQVCDAFEKTGQLFTDGDRKGLNAWLAQNKHIATLVPSLTADVVQQGYDAVTRFRDALTQKIRDSRKNGGTEMDEKTAALDVFTNDPSIATDIDSAKTWSAPNTSVPSDNAAH